MDLVFGQDVAVAQWVAERIPHIGEAAALGPMVAIGVARDNALVAGVVYHNYLPRYEVGEVTFAAATPRWATRGIIRALLHVPFEQYRWRRLSAVVRHDNARVQKFLAGLGFKREGAAREMFGSVPKVHGVIYGMLTREYDALLRRLG